MSDGPLIDDSMDEIVQEFLAESAEGLDQFDRDIVALESDPRSTEHLGSAFRIFHTIKGTSGFLGFPTLEELTHGAETLLSKLRDGNLLLDADSTNILLSVSDTIRNVLADIEQTGAEPMFEISHLVERLKEVQEAGEGIDTNSDDANDKGAFSNPDASHSTNIQDGVSSTSPDNGAHGQQSNAVAEGTASARPNPIEEISTTAVRHITDKTVRVDVELLDSLMRQVGELVLARNEVMSSADSSEDSVLNQTVQRLSLIVSELQEGVMKTRMQPLAQLWSTLPRIVRDLAALFDKKVRLQMEGGETELDRTVLEAIRGPFTHLVRNSIDHGIESLEERVRLGKSAHGTLTVRAYHEGGQVILEAVDDGHGIDLGKIGAKAIELGLITPEQLENMSARDITDFIFAPGFSTAETITNVSGRGVGMDVVRSNIESIGGSVDVISRPGKGTTFKIKIPLTLAIIPALLIGCRDQKFAIPQPNLIEMLHIGTQASPAVVERIGDATVCRLRGHLLPLVRLDELFGYSMEEQVLDGAATVAVLQADDMKFGLVFDEVFETQEIVVKPLGSLVKQIDAFAGATILGDGTVALIADVVGLASLAGIAETSSRLSESGHEISDESEEEKERSAFVILRVGENRTVAIPVEQIARLEEIPSENVEKSGEIDVVQYRGNLMRLVRLHEVLGILGHSVVPDASLKVVVHESDHGPIGFVVAEMVDVLEDVVDLMDVDSGYGLAGAVVLHGRVTDVLDLETAILWMQREGFFAQAR
ncbi:MAG TPA: chemotaxis protein CheW [Acidimicrobiales bacterium]|nr:chemotaxis protein CheW [Acidimicrobiales bacterium]